MKDDSKMQVSAPSREALIDHVRQLAARGHSARFIADTLNVQGVPTLSGRRGARWQHGTVANIAKESGFRVAYRGTQVHGMGSPEGGAAGAGSVALPEAVRLLGRLRGSLSAEVAGAESMCSKPTAAIGAP